jgi:hypothetical protein
MKLKKEQENGGLKITNGRDGWNKCCISCFDHFVVVKIDLLHKPAALVAWT